MTARVSLGRACSSRSAKPGRLNVFPEITSSITRWEDSGQGMLPLMKLLLRSTLLYSELYLQGIDVDLDYLEQLEQELDAKAQAARDKLSAIAPHVNPARPKQLSAYLFDELKLPTEFQTRWENCFQSAGILSRRLSDHKPNTPLHDAEERIFPPFRKCKTRKPLLVLCNARS